MNYSLLKTLLVLLLLGLTALPSLAEEKKAEKEKMKGKVGVALKFAHTPIGDSSLDSIDANFDSTTFVGLGVSYFPIENCSLELTVGSLETNIHLKAGSESAFFGKLEQIPVLLTAKVRNSSFFDKITLYGGGGIGYYFNDISDNNLAGGKVNSFFALNRTVTKTDNSFGLHGVAGFEYAFTKNVALDADFTFSFTDATVEVRRADGSTKKFDVALNALMIGFGLKYYF